MTRPSKLFVFTLGFALTLVVGALVVALGAMIGGAL